MYKAKTETFDAAEHTIEKVFDNDFRLGQVLFSSLVARWLSAQEDDRGVPVYEMENRTPWDWLNETSYTSFEQLASHYLM